MVGMRAPRKVRVEVSDVGLSRPDGTAAALGGGVQVVVLMRHRH